MYPRGYRLTSNHYVISQGLRYRNEAAHRRTPTVATGAADQLSSVWGRGNGAGVTDNGTHEATPTGIPSPWTLPFTGDSPTRTQRLLHGLLSVGVQWGFARLRRHGLVHGWGGAESVSVLFILMDYCVLTDTSELHPVGL